MPYPIDKRLVVGISSSALFDLEKEDQLFKSEGLEAYREHQIQFREKPLGKGLAFPFIKRFLNINRVYSDKLPVEVVLLSKNSPETGIRIFNSIQEYELDITRAAFTSGKSPHVYLPTFNVSLFLSTNKKDVNEAVKLNYPSGHILKSIIEDELDESELRVAFDFDGVVIDDESEKIYKKDNQLDAFHNYEVKNNVNPHNPGILAEFFKKLAFFQKLEAKNSEKDPSYKKILRTAIITARNAPAHERAIKTLEDWEVTVDEMLFMGGIDKKRALEIMKPHIFIDDQITHLNQEIKNITLVHIPFGIANE